MRASSAPARRTRVHIGDGLRDAFDDVGSAGGHREMAGGEIPLGTFADYADEGALVRIVGRVVTHRLVGVVDLVDEGDPGEK